MSLLTNVLLLALFGADSGAVAKLAAKDWKLRREGFNQVTKLPAASRTDAMKVGLIGALDRENTLVAGGAALGDDFSEYYSTLIESVAAMKDSRSVNALLGALASGKMAADALVAIGEPSVDPAIERMRNTTSRSVRRDTCDVLRRLAAPQSGLKEMAKNKIGKEIAACQQ